MTSAAGSADMGGEKNCRTRWIAGRSVGFIYPGSTRRQPVGWP
jgi:hypothetical protein